MSEKSVRPHVSHQQAAADCINQALEKSDIAEICHAIGAATVSSVRFRRWIKVKSRKHPAMERVMEQSFT